MSENQVVSNTSVPQNADNNADVAQNEQNQNLQENTVEGQEASKEKIKFQAKIDGKEENVELGLDEIKRDYQKWKAASKRFEEASAKEKALEQLKNESELTKKQVQMLVEALKKDPFKVLSHPSMGVKVREAAERYLVEQLKQEQLDPREKELQEAKRALAEREEELKQFEAQKHEAKVKSYVEQFKTQLTESISKALDASKLPKTEVTVSRIAYYMAQGKRGGQNVTAEQAVQLVQRDDEAYLKAKFGGITDGAVLAEFLGEDIVKRLREYDVARIKTIPVENKKTTEPKDLTDDERGMSLEQLFKRKFKN